MNDKHATGDTIQQRTNKAGVSKKSITTNNGLIQIKTFWQN